LARTADLSTGGTVAFDVCAGYLCVMLFLSARPNRTRLHLQRAVPSVLGGPSWESSLQLHSRRCVDDNLTCELPHRISNFSMVAEFPRISRYNPKKHDKRITGYTALARNCWEICANRRSVLRAIKPRLSAAQRSVHRVAGSQSREIRNPKSFRAHMIAWVAAADTTM
jgi:hypothetical protein